MCKASIIANHVTQAREGETYGIELSDHGLGALVPAGSTSEQCVACVKNGAMLTVSNIPQTLQDKYALDATAVAIFIEKPDNYHDQLEFQNG